MRTAIDINEQFGVGDDLFPESEDAFLPSVVSMPQFSDEGDEPLNPPLPITNRWHPQLIMDLALGLDDTEAIRVRHGLTEQDLETLYTIPSFKRDIAVLMRELNESGVTFSRKAALQAESYLSTIDAIMLNPNTPAATRVDIFKTVTKFGKLEPKEEKDTGNTNQVVVNISY